MKLRLCCGVITSYFSASIANKYVIIRSTRVPHMVQGTCPVLSQNTYRPKTICTQKSSSLKNSEMPQDVISEHQKSCAFHLNTFAPPPRKYIPGSNFAPLGNFPAVQGKVTPPLLNPFLGQPNRCGLSSQMSGRVWLRRKRVLKGMIY